MCDLALRCVNVAADGLEEYSGGVTVLDTSGTWFAALEPDPETRRTKLFSRFFLKILFFYFLFYARCHCMLSHLHSNRIAQRQSYFNLSNRAEDLILHFVIWSTFSTCDIQRRHGVHFLTEFRTSKEDDRRYFPGLSMPYSYGVCMYTSVLLKT